MHSTWIEGMSAIDQAHAEFKAKLKAASRNLIALGLPR
jgi:hypothetical protein